MGVENRNQIEEKGSQTEEKHRKVRRGKRIRRNLENFKILYVNIRGIKSKVKSLENIVQEEKPALIAIAETILEEKEEIDIEGYHVLPKNKTAEGQGRGILIAVKEEIKHITTIVMEDDDPAEQMWVRISNGRINVRIGLIYAPQESRTKKAELKRMYDKIKEQIEIGRNNKQKILALGDFNCKIGEEVKGNTSEITMGGKMLQNLTEKTNMEIINTTELCKGTWTREEGGKKSVLDYVLINKEEIGSVEEMNIDEGKEITPYGMEQNRRVYTDHNTITLQINWVLTSLEHNKMSFCMTQKGKEMLKEVTENSKLSEIWEEKETTVQAKYTRWSQEVTKITDKIFMKTKKRKSRRCRKIKQLQKQRKILLCRWQTTTNKEEKDILKFRRNLILDFIREIQMKQERTKITEIANKIRKEGGFDGNAFWKHAEMMRGRKAEPATAMKKENGEIEEDPEKIKDIYRDFYTKLLKDRQPEDDDEIKIQEHKEQCIDLMKKAASRKMIEPANDEEYEQMKKKLKKKKAPDKQGWRYEFIQWAGKDMENSIKLMINEVLRTKTQIEEWHQMTIKSVSKNSKKRMEMQYKRGLFLTNILSKSMERILLNRRQEAIEDSVKPFQFGGITHVSIADNSFIMNNVIAEFKREKKNLYIIFGDLEKCFDKLYLKDCIIELVDAGVPIEEAMFIYDMNRHIEAEVDTPHGKTKMFKIEEAVRQGTIFGTTLCGVSTNRINKMGNPDPLILHNKILIQCPIYVDDIAGMGGKRQIENTGIKMNGLEKTKKFEFNNKEDKTEVMAMKFNKQTEVEEAIIEVRKGKVKNTDLYKYVGDHYDRSGTNEIKIVKKMQKSKYMAHSVRRMGSYINVGDADMKTRLMLLESVVKLTLLSNVETWCMISTKEESSITTKHHEILCTVLGLKRSTPYYGIIGETGIWPYIHVITYKKLMFLHHLVHSEDRRVSKRIVLVQESQQMEDTWYSELKDKAKEMQLEIKTKEVEKYEKSTWKKMVKEKIKENIERELQQQYETKSKLRFLKDKPFQEEEYLNVGNAAQCQNIMEIRLNMVDLKMNFKGMYEDTVCTGCFEKEETTEHFIQCKKMQELTGHNIKTNNIKEDIKSTEWLMEMSELMKTLTEVRKHRLQYR